MNKSNRSVRDIIDVFKYELNRFAMDIVEVFKFWNLGNLGGSFILK
jgi:hypothetical protein